ELVTAALRLGRERGDAGSALYPFRTAFYGSLGYGTAGVAHQYQIAPAMLADSAERARVELLEDSAARAGALACYSGWARTQTGQLERSEATWAASLNVPGRALFGYRCEPGDEAVPGGGAAAAAGELEGYALVTYRSDLPPQSRFLEIEELVWRTSSARR